jgi:hypothetical protein
MKTPLPSPVAWTALLSHLMLAVAPPTAVGQEAEPDSAARDIRLYGRVLDAATGLPVFGALVRPTGNRPASATDTAGAWVLEVPEAEEYVIALVQLGYRTALLTLPTKAPREFTTVLLGADPIELEGLEVLVDRFEERRGFCMGSVKVLDQQRLVSAQAASVGVCLDEEPVYRAATELERYSVADVHLMWIASSGAAGESGCDQRRGGPGYPLGGGSRSYGPSSRLRRRAGPEGGVHQAVS